MTEKSSKEDITPVVSWLNNILWALVVLLLTFYGTPDLMDGIIDSLMRE